MIQSSKMIQRWCMYRSTFVAILPLSDSVNPLGRELGRKEKEGERERGRERRERGREGEGGREGRREGGRGERE